MPTPQLLNEIINVLLMLAPAAAVVCLVLGGISLRREGGGITFVLGGGFSKWMVCCVVFLTPEPLLTWFSSFGVAVPLPGGGVNSAWLASLESDITTFVNSFILGKFVTTVAAYLVLRAILDAASGEPFLPSLIAALGAELACGLHAARGGPRSRANLCGAVRLEQRAARGRRGFLHSLRYSPVGLIPLVKAGNLA